MEQYEKAGDEGLPLVKVAFATMMARPLYYSNNDFTEKLAKLMRRASFTKKEIDQLREIGFIVEVGIREAVIPDGYK